MPQVRPDDEVEDFISWDDWSCWLRVSDICWSAEMVTTAVFPPSPSSSSSSLQSATLLWWSFCLSFLASKVSSSKCSKQDSILRSMSGLARTPLAKASRIMEVPKLIWKCRMVLKFHRCLHLMFSTFCVQLRQTMSRMVWKLLDPHSFGSCCWKRPKPLADWQEHWIWRENNRNGGRWLCHLHDLVENFFEAEQINDSVRPRSKAHLYTGHNLKAHKV